MFDLRYHVASLAAVFLALIIGILVGVGISGPVDSAKTKFLEEQVAKYQRQLDQSATQSGEVTRDQQAARTFINETYPVLVRNRLRGKKIAVVFVGSVDGGIRKAVKGLLEDSGAQQLRLRSLKVPVDVRQLGAALKSQSAAVGLRGRKNVEELGRSLGEELMLGGDTPLWDSLTGSTPLVEEVVGGSKAPADGVVVVRTVTPQRGATSRFLLGLYSGLAATPVPAVGVERTDAAESATKAFAQGGLSSVDDVDNPAGRLATVLLLAGAPPGQYGVKDTADETLPPFPPRTAAGG
ncbi:MAG: copper transporter [Gaiellaceae bacterium]